MRSLILHIIQRKKWVINHIIQRNVDNKQQTMKGKIEKTEEGWNVMYDQRTWQDPSAEDGMLPLHPDDVKQINADAQVFDNIEARIAAYPDVEFEIVDYSQKCRECGETVERGRNCSKKCFMKPGNFIPTDKLEYAKLLTN